MLPAATAFRSLSQRPCCLRRQCRCSASAAIEPSADSISDRDFHTVGSRTNRLVEREQAAGSDAVVDELLVPQIATVEREPEAIVVSIERNVGVQERGPRPPREIVI